MSKVLLSISEAAQSPLEKLRTMGMKTEISPSGEVRVSKSQDRPTDSATAVIFDEAGEGS
jgi:hypothetical protein